MVNLRAIKGILKCANRWQTYQAKPDTNPQIDDELAANPLEVFDTEAQ